MAINMNKLTEKAQEAIVAAQRLAEERHHTQLEPEHLLHALVAMDLPGPGSVFLSQNWKFTAPVYIGDTITAEAEVVSVHATKPVTQLKIAVTRQTGETVLEGEAWCYTMRPSPGA